MCFYFKETKRSRNNMKFKMAKNHGCLNCNLEALSKGDNVLLEWLELTDESVRKIEDIMQVGIKRENQELLVRYIHCKKSEFEKLQKDRRYKMRCMSLIEDGPELVGVEMNFGNIEIMFDMQDVEYDSDKISIQNAKIMAYPFGDYDFKTLDDEEIE